MHDLFLHTAETTTTMCTKKTKQIATDLYFTIINQVTKQFLLMIIQNISINNKERCTNAYFIINYNYRI